MFFPIGFLCSRYFQGDLRIASYEGYGTDVSLYIPTLASEAVEHLPVFGTTASEKLLATGVRVPDWTSTARFNRHKGRLAIR